MRILHDFYFKEAKRLGYVARSAFKLQEIDAKHHVLRPGASVLDLGCHPGAWLQVACQALGPPRVGGHVIGIDLKATPVPAHCDSRVTTLVADAKRVTPGQLARLCPAGFSAVLSDMAPATSGVASLDATRSQVLAELAVRIALGDWDGMIEGGDAADGHTKGVLRPGGALVLKLLEGSGSDRQVLQALTVPRFRKVHWMRPKATRSESSEVYLVATGLKLQGFGIS